MKKIHIQESVYKRFSLCGKLWTRVKGGLVRSDTDPPAVFNEESGSVNAATCKTCRVVLRQSRLK